MINLLSGLIPFETDLSPRYDFLAVNFLILLTKLNRRCRRRIPLYEDDRSMSCLSGQFFNGAEVVKQLHGVSYGMQSSRKTISPFKVNIRWSEQKSHRAEVGVDSKTKTGHVLGSLILLLGWATACLYN